MHQKGFMSHFKKWHEKFKISKELKGDKLTVTFSGKKNDVAKLDRKIDAMHVMMEDCCEEGSCC